ncbi:MAG: GIY-YIG nuclease family protein [Planctomycetes bacterium]|nr:GIY-YIG nuclease family protein [Planctomycetota bacterium]
MTREQEVDAMMQELVASRRVLINPVGIRPASEMTREQEVDAFLKDLYERRRILPNPPMLFDQDKSEKAFCPTGPGGRVDNSCPPKEAKMNMRLSYDDPLTAVFLRTLAWELYVADRKLLVKEIAEKLVQTARGDLGLLKNKGGAPHAFIQSLQKPGKQGKQLLSRAPIRPLERGWQDAWRLLYLPSHRFVRMLSDNPVWTHLSDKTKKAEPLQLSLSLRTPAAPKLLVTVGSGPPTKSLLDKAPCGLYFLRETEGLYVGQSDEFDVRWRQHTKKNLKWWVFIAPEEENTHFYRDALYAAEGLLISFWTEICTTTNWKRSKDKKPAFTFLQPAILLVEAASAAMIWLIRERRDLGLKPWELPFKSCRADHWPSCYLRPFNEMVD